MGNKPFLYAFSCALLPPRFIAESAAYFGSAENAWKAEDERWQACGGFHPLTLKKFLRFRKSFSVEREWEKFEDSPIAAVAMDEPGYPVSLKSISDPPALLFYQGDLSSLSSPCLAIVGSRKASALGEAKARKMAETLASCGITIVSGLALGIDSAAHRGALDGGGKTAAVLGTGHEIIYPFQNQNLAAQIKSRGVLVSEFPPKTPPAPWNFPRRNRLISGLSLGVVVAEAGEKSGALITAKFAGEEGREVFALPGDPAHESARGTNALIKDGATLVQEIGDILAEFPYLSSVLTPENPGNQLEEKILAVLRKDGKGKDLETLARMAGLPIDHAVSSLLMMEVDGRVCRLPGNIYAVAL